MAGALGPSPLREAEEAKKPVYDVHAVIYHDETRTNSHYYAGVVAVREDRGGQGIKFDVPLNGSGRNKAREKIRGEIQRRGWRIDRFELESAVEEKKGNKK